MDIELQEEVMLAELFGSLPESVILFKPLFNSNDEVTDFEIAYCNKATTALIKFQKDVILKQTICTTNLVDDTFKNNIFKNCLEVWQTGKPNEEIIYNELFDRRFSALRSKTKHGVISVTRDRTEFYKAEKARQDQLNDFTNILNASADGVMILEALRDADGEVVDFVLQRCNKAAFNLARLSPASIGKKLTELLPHLQMSEQLNLHKKVINTGVPERIETTFRSEDGSEYGWFIVSLMKMEDSVVSTFIDISEKKNNEQKIEEQADLLNGIFEASINAIFACHAIRDATGEIIDLRIIKINEAFVALIGLSAEVAEGATYHVIFPAGKKAGFFDLYCEVIETGRSLRKEIFYDHDNLTGWYDVSAVKRGANGIVVTFNNITQSKLDKQAIEDSSRYLQDVIDSSQTGILLLAPVKDGSGQIIDFTLKTVNETLAALINKKPADLIGKRLNEVLPDSLENGVFQHYKQLAEGKESAKRIEMHHKTGANDNWLDILVKKRNEDLVVTYLDITPSKKLQQEIATSAEKLSTVINTSPAGMFTLQPVFNAEQEIEDFRFVIVNQTVATYIGQTSEVLTGTLGSEYFQAYKTNGLFEIYKDTFLHNKQHQFPFHYEDGYDLYFNINTIRAGDEVLVTFTDHTTLKKLQVQLEASIEELKKSNASLEEFAYAASHDLQEPLRKINYFAERLRKGMGQRLSEEESRMFERMENAANRMSRLINDLLTYSQISRGTETFKPTDLAEVIQQVLSDLETTIIEKNASVSIGALPVVEGDALQLRQLFQNLLSNSLKYSQKDVSPIISIACNEVTKQAKDGLQRYFEITITDNGIGFEQEHAERIFKVFQRLHGQSEFPGTGIGLAIVQKVIENHNGFISAESSLGQGSTFTVLLPKN